MPDSTPPPLDLDALERAVAKMTQGEWWLLGHGIARPWIGRDLDGALQPLVWSMSRHSDELAGIVALRNAAPALIRAAREAERLREVVAHLRGEKPGVARAYARALGEIAELRAERDRLQERVDQFEGWEYGEGWSERDAVDQALPEFEFAHVSGDRDDANLGERVAIFAERFAEMAAERDRLQAELDATRKTDHRSPGELTLDLPDAGIINNPDTEIEE